MDFFELLAFLLLLATGALWYSSLNVRELAVSEARAVCAAEGLLLLDDTVSIARIGLARDGDGVVQLRRVYEFEYSDTGNDRRSGSMLILGGRVLVIHLTPQPGWDCRPCIEPGDLVAGQGDTVDQAAPKLIHSSSRMQSAVPASKSAIE